MTIGRLFTLLFVAVVTVAMLPERASAQCWYCDKCWWGGGKAGKSCVMMILSPIIGFTDCHQDAPCHCYVLLSDVGFCYASGTAAETAEYETELAETLAAIRTKRSVPADGSFFYAKRGSEFVVRRKCDAAEVGRVAVSEVEPLPVPGAG